MLRRLLLMTMLCAMAAVASARVVVVHMYNFNFTTDPTHTHVTSAVIHVGDTVRWVIDESFHCTTSCAGMTESWASGVMSGVGTSFDHKFTHAGVFGFYCCLHGFDNGNGTGAGMAGHVVVLAPLPIQPNPHTMIQREAAPKVMATVPCPMCDAKRQPAAQSDRVRSALLWFNW